MDLLYNLLASKHIRSYPIMMSSRAYIYLPYSCHSPLKLVRFRNSFERNSHLRTGHNPDISTARVNNLCFNRMVCGLLMIAVACSLAHTEEFPLQSLAQTTDAAGMLLGCPVVSVDIWFAMACLLTEGIHPEICIQTSDGKSHYTTGVSPIDCNDLLRTSYVYIYIYHVMYITINDVYCILDLLPSSTNKLLQ